MAAKFGPISIKNAVDSWTDLGFGVNKVKINIGVKMPDIDPIVPVEKAIAKAASSLFPFGSSSKKKS